LYTLFAVAGVELVGLFVCAYYFASISSNKMATNSAPTKEKPTKHGQDVEMQRLTQHMSNPMRRLENDERTASKDGNFGPSERKTSSANMLSDEVPAEEASATLSATPWKAHQTEDGHLFYEDTLTGRTTWTNHEKN
jgi:hypothetical protein